MIFMAYMDQHPELRKDTRASGILYSAQIVNRSLIESGRVQCLGREGYTECDEIKIKNIT